MTVSAITVALIIGQIITGRYRLAAVFAISLIGARYTTCSENPAHLALSLIVCAFLCSVHITGISRLIGVLYALRLFPASLIYFGVSWSGTWTLNMILLILQILIAAIDLSGGFSARMARMGYSPGLNRSHWNFDRLPFRRKT